MLCWVFSLLSHRVAPWGSGVLTSFLQWKLFLINQPWRTHVYGQAIQGGCCLALSITPAQTVPASPTPHTRDWPSCILANDCSYHRGGEGPRTSCHVLPAVIYTRWGVTPGLCFTCGQPPHSLSHGCFSCWLRALSMACFFFFFFFYLFVFFFFFFL